MSVPSTALLALPSGPFRCIVADPPWPMPETGRRTSRSTTHSGEYVAKGGRVVNADWWNRKTDKTVKIPYQTMTVDEIAAMPVSGVAAKDAHLYIWTINKYIEQTYAIARAWGFKPSCLLTWAKNPHGIGIGGTYVQTSEHVLFARRGTCKALRRVDSTWWTWPRGRHSAKPEAFQDMVETVSPGPYLEMFARRRRLGWTTWGNEVDTHAKESQKTD